MNLNEVVNQSIAIRRAYHELEEQQMGRKWTITEDALAFSTDAALVNRLVMDKTGSWPTDESSANLADKIGESVWWLAVLADRNGVDFQSAVESFLADKKEKFDIN